MDRKGTGFETRFTANRKCIGITEAAASAGGHPSCVTWLAILILQIKRLLRVGVQTKTIACDRSLCLSARNFASFPSVANLPRLLEELCTSKAGCSCAEIRSASLSVRLHLVRVEWNKRCLRGIIKLLFFSAATRGAKSIIPSCWQDSSSLCGVYVYTTSLSLSSFRLIVSAGSVNDEQRRTRNLAGGLLAVTRRPKQRKTRRPRRFLTGNFRDSNLVSL